METQIKKANAKAANAKAAKDDMEKQLAKAEKAAKAEINKAKRLENATNRFNALKKREDKIGFANQTIALTRALRAESVTVQGAIDALNIYIKEVTKANSLNKKIVASLKGEAAQTILQQITNSTLPLYVDNKGLYKVEALYRLVASKAKNTELRTLLTNINKQASK